MVYEGYLRNSLLVLILLLNACSGSEDRELEYLNRAQAYFNENNYDKARVEIKNVLQINPKNLDARYLSALLAEKNQNWRSMHGLLLGVVAEKPEFLEAKNKLGKLFLLGGQLDKALQNSENILTKDPDNLDALILKAAVLLRRDDLLHSEEILTSVLKDKPGYVEATLLLAKLKVDQNKIEEALALLDNAIAVNPDDFTLKLFKINYLVALKDFQGAEKVFLPLVKQYPDKANLHYSFAKFYIVWGNVDKGEKVLRDYIQSRPDEIEPKLALAEFLLQQKGVIEAEQSLKKFINENTKNDEFRFALARVYSDSPEKAVSVLSEIIAADEDGIATIKATNLLAKFAVKQGDKDKARQLLDEVIKKDPRNSEALMMRSSLLVDKGSYEAAIADLRMVLRDEPDSEKAFMLSANAHLKSGFFDLAQDSLEKVLLLNPNNIAVRKDLARLKVKNKDEKGAIKLLETVGVSEHKSPDVLALLVDLYIRTENWDSAEEAARSIPESDQVGLSSYKLAQVFFTQKKYSLAVEEYLKVLAVKPLDVGVLAQLVESYLAMKMPEKAEVLLDDLIAKNRENPSLLNLRGILHQRLNQAAQAQAAFEKVISLDEKFAPGYRNLASVFFRRGDFDNALINIQQGLNFLPDNEVLLIAAAGLYEKAADFNGSMDMYARVLKVNRDNKIAANNLAALIVRTSEDSERLKYALSLVKGFKNYKIPALLDTYGWLSYLNGEYEEALIALEKVVDLAPDYPEFKYHLGMVYLTFGRTEEAKLALENAISNGDNFVGVEKAKVELEVLKNS